MAKKNLRMTIRGEIIQSGMTIPKIATEVGLNHNTLYNYLKGKTDMKPDNLTKLLKFLRNPKKEQDKPEE